MASSDIFLQTNNLQFFSPRDIYEAYLSEENLDDYFYDNYGMSYRFLFGDLTPDRFVATVLYSSYRNDFLIRYSFFKNVLSKNNNAISFFELPVNDSRADIVSINGKSIAYEIKTQYDTLERLNKQLNDYAQAFEYVYVICDDENLDNVVGMAPSYCGIYTYSRHSKLVFKLFRKALRSTMLNSEIMLNMMLKKEKSHYFKKDSVDDILVYNDEKKINSCFKEALKQRFASKTNDISLRCESLF